MLGDFAELAVTSVGHGLDSLEDKGLVITEFKNSHILIISDIYDIILAKILNLIMIFKLINLSKLDARRHTRFNS